MSYAGHVDRTDEIIDRKKKLIKNLSEPSETF